MLDAGAGPALLLAVGEHLPLEARIELAAQEGENVGSRKLKQSMVQQSWVELGKFSAVAEEHVSAELGLIDDPIIGEPLQPGLLSQRPQDGLGPPVQDLGPR